MKYLIFVILLILTLSYCNENITQPPNVQQHTNTETHQPIQTENHVTETHTTTQPITQTPNVETHPPVVETHPPVVETHAPVHQTEAPHVEVHADHIDQSNQHHEEQNHHQSEHSTEPHSHEEPGEVHAQPDGTFMTITVNQREEDCFFEEIPGDHLFTMDFEVTKGGLLDIEFKIKNEQDQVLYSKVGLFSSSDDTKNEAAGHVEYRTHHSSIYALCFDNTNSRWTAKTVSVFIPTIKDSKTQLGSPDVHHDLATSDHLTPFIESVIKISEELDSIERVQHHLRVRESVHRDSMSIFKIIIIFS